MTVTADIFESVKESLENLCEKIYKGRSGEAITTLLKDFEGCMKVDCKKWKSAEVQDNRQMVKASVGWLSYAGVPVT